MCTIFLEFVLGGDSLVVVESRKAWRNREASASEGVLALLEALRVGLGAESVGLFDDDRADPAAAPGALNLWDSFGERPCIEIDWEAWYRQLRADGRVDVTCRCGAAHRLCGFSIHERWTLILVAPPVLPAGGAVAIASSLRALSEKLPPAMTPDERRQAGLAGAGEDESVPARGAWVAPVWWVRRRPA